MGSGKRDFKSRHERAKGEVYFTHPKMIELLLEKEEFKGVGWEPASGDGCIAKYFPNIIASDIRRDDWVYGDKGIDFLTTYKKVDYIITNPPYSLSLEFAKHSLECADKIVLILMLQVLNYEKFQEVFRIKSFKKVYLMTPQPSFKNKITKKTCGLAAGWFIWDKEYEGKPFIDWLIVNRT